MYKSLKHQESSRIHKMWYDSKSNTLKVEFTKGGIYIYHNVSPDIVKELCDPSKSLGKQFQKLIIEGGFFYEKQK